MSPVVLEEINNAMHKVGEKDFQRSYEEGKLEGKKEVTVEFVKRMFDKGFSLDEISDALGLSQSEIMDIKSTFKYDSLPFRKFFLKKFKIYI